MPNEKTIQDWISEQRQQLHAAMTAPDSETLPATRKALLNAQAANLQAMAEALGSFQNIAQSLASTHQVTVANFATA